MGFKNNAYATVWKSKTTENTIDMFDRYAEVFITTSKKNSATQTYETDFSSRVRFLGKAFEKLKNLTLEEKDKLKLLEVETTNKFDKVKNVQFTNHLCWDFEKMKKFENKKDKYTEPKTSNDAEWQPINPSEDLPF